MYGATSDPDPSIRAEVVYEDMEGRRVPDGISYTSANLRYTGWKHPVTDMVNRDVNDPKLRPNYENVRVNRAEPRPSGDFNWQLGLTYCWVVPRGHFVISNREGKRRYMAHRQLNSELQPRTLRSGERCTHVQPVRDHCIDSGRFDRCQSLTMRKDPNPHSVVDPRGPTEVYYWGFGFLASLTVVVEEDVTSDEETSSDESESDRTESDATATGSEEDEAPIQVKAIFTSTDIRFR